MSSVFGPYAEFQSTLPAWGATTVRRHNNDSMSISIHAPRVGSDAFSAQVLKEMGYFNPRSP